MISQAAACVGQDAKVDGLSPGAPEQVPRMGRAESSVHSAFEDVSLETESVPWVRQYKVLFRKCVLLQLRQPVQLVIALLAPMVFVLVAYGLHMAAGGNVSADSLPALNTCGAPDTTVPIPSESWYNYTEGSYTQHPFPNGGNFTNSYNTSPPHLHNLIWVSGTGIFMLSLGPLIFSLIVLINVAREGSTRLLGILRNLGMSESAYWVSWYSFYSIITLINSLIAAGVTQALPVHVFEASAFGPIFASIFFFELCLISVAFLIAAFSGSHSQPAGWLYFVLFLATAGLIMGFSFIFDVRYHDYGNLGYYALGQGWGSFWQYLSTKTCRETIGFGRNITTGEECDLPGGRPHSTCQLGGFKCNNTCDLTIVASEFDTLTTGPFPDQVSEIFTGCYMLASSYDYWYAGNGAQKLGLAAFWFMPWYHFGKLWSLMLGATQLPGKSFESHMIGWDTVKIAYEAIPGPRPTSIGGTLMPEFSTIKLGNPTYQKYTPLITNCPVTPIVPGTCSSQICRFSVTGPVNSAPSFGITLVYLVLLNILYFTVAVWFAVVVPMGNGVPHKAWFPFTKAYWCPGNRDEPEPEMGKPKAAVTTSLLTKAFGEFQAVKGVSLSMSFNEVFCLVGHNGAGKSTCINMLVGNTCPTSGTASIFGHDISTSINQVRKMIGVCPQDDFLYNNLTALEHLELFATLRGVNPLQLKATVLEWLEDMNLTEVSNNRSCTYSGGMKRRLSVALATIGNTRFVVLDEPTTGMDPCNRRYVWKHIEKIKQGRTILLTTHAMEEADLLADYVSVMHQGSVAAEGTPLDLKRRFGTAIQFNVLVENNAITSTQQLISDELLMNVDHKLDMGAAGNLTVQIASVNDCNVASLTQFLDWLQSPDSPVLEYGISNSSLEEVFLVVTGQNTEALGGEVDDCDPVATTDVCCSCCCTGCIRCCLSGWCKCCCRPKPKQNTTPPELDLDEGDDNAYNGEELVAHLESISHLKPNLALVPQLHAMLKKRFETQWTGSPSIGVWILCPILIFAGFGTFFAIPYSPGNTQMANVFFTLFLSLLLPIIISPVITEYEMGLWNLMRTQGLMGRAFILQEVIYIFSVQFIYDIVFVTLLLGTSYLNVELCDGADCPRSAHIFPQLVENFQGREEVQQLRVFPVPGDYGQLFAIIFLFAISVVGSALLCIPLFRSQRAAFAISGIYVVGVGVACPLILSLVMKYDGDKPPKYCIDDVMFCNGTESIPFTDPTSQIMQCIVMQYIDVKVYCTSPYAAMLPQFGLALTFAMYSVSDIEIRTLPVGSADVFTSYVDQSTDVSCSGTTCKSSLVRAKFNEFLGYFALGAVILVILGLLFVGAVRFTPTWLQRVFNQFKLAGKCIRHPFDFFTAKSEPNRKLMNEKAVPMNHSEDSTVKEETELVKRILAPWVSKASEDVETGRTEGLTVDLSKVDRECLPPVVVQDLAKAYPSFGGLPPKVALKGLNLHVDKGQVLGLLGPNGAGKTTALKILAGLHDSTSGVAFVGGYHIELEKLSAFEVLGNCPQFDVIWPNMTVKKHLEFIARLKGLPSAQIQDIALTMARAVGIGGIAFNRKAQHLSGGMRRRLSIAIALIGAPEIVLLDEPTTGLDPSTRNRIWNLIKLFMTPERGIIITTHMMTEADALCNRIGIMTRGELRVLGTQQRLKNEYGSGFTMQISLARNSREDANAAMQFLKTNVDKGAVLVNRHGKTLRVQLPSKDLNLTQTFREMYSKEAKILGSISEWLLNQSSLEDVFINIAHDEL
mmetsp:Transcript_3349/g.6402  ORF Transcript_3349/g.6402 Transcript_3349/m.6402 type:complete len:1761 (+) Transcript_3349:6162-11444(+)